MGKRCLGTVALWLLTVGSVTAEDAAKAEMKKLEGTWQLVSATRDGKETPADQVKKVRVVIKGGKHTVYVGDEVAAKEIPFTVDPTRDPRTTVDTLPDGKQIKGIYKARPPPRSSPPGRAPATRSASSSASSRERVRPTRVARP
jgi:uncharacterized protein (TIGR03067 family)